MTFLSPYVHEVLIEYCMKTEKCYQDYSFINSDFSLDWSNIRNFVFRSTDVETFNLLEAPEDWYKTILLKVWQVLHGVQRKMETSGKDVLIDGVMTKLNWTNRSEEIMRCYEESRDCDSMDSPVHTYALLHLIAVLDSSLSRIYLTKDKNVPFLLRDKINSDVIVNMLGKIPVLFIQLIMGHPKTLNIRNIVWHGFTASREIPKCLPTIVFLLIADIGYILLSKGILFRDLPMCNMFDFKEHCSLLKGCFPDFDLDLNSFQYLVKTSRYICSTHHSLWYLSYYSFQEKRYGRSAVLLLPQLEHLLRCIFCESNNTPKRLLTAESDTLYTTLDEILAPHLEDGKTNKLYYTLKEQIILMLLDVLVYPAGPRIRDRLSHGECNVISFPGVLSNHMLFIACCVIMQSQSENYTDQVEASITDLALEENRTLRYFVQQCASYIDRYESVYHPVSALKSKLIHSVCRLEKWCLLPKPDNYETSNLAEFEKSLLKISDVLAKFMFISSNGGTASLNDLKMFLNEVRLNSLTSLNKPGKYVSLSTNILSRIEDICSRVEETSEHKWEEWRCRSMRSRSRYTYCKMLVTLPVLRECIICVLCILGRDLADKHLNSNMERCLQPRMKTYKRILKCLENVSTYCEKTNNKWNNVSDQIVKMSILFSEQSVVE